MKKILLPLTLLFCCFPATLFAQLSYTPYAITTLNSLGGANGGNILYAYRPYDVAIYGNSNVYVVCYQEYTIHKFWTTNGTNWSREVFAGSPNLYGSNDGTGTGARFGYPNSLATDSHGNLFVSDSGNYTIRKITPEGVVTTFAGKPGVQGNTNGIGGEARFGNGVGSLAIDTNDNIYVSEYSNNRLRKITPGAAVSTVAIGAPTVAEWGGGICVGPDGNIYHASSTQNIIRKITPGGAVTTIAGLAGAIGSVDGTNSSARFNGPNDIVADSFGNLFVAEGNALVRKVAPVGTNWVVTTIAGSPGLRGNNNGSGSSARFTVPGGITIDSDGRLYIADNDNGLGTGGTIRLAVPNGVNRWTSVVNGKWEEAAKWSAGIPSLRNTVNYITNAASKIVLIDANTVTSNAASLTINQLGVSAPNGSTNTLALFDTGLSNPLTVHESLGIESGGVVLITTNSAMTVENLIGVGLTNGNAFLSINGGSVLNSADAYVGIESALVNGVQIDGAGSIWNNSKTLTVGYYANSTNAVFVREVAALNVTGMASLGEGCDGNVIGITDSGSTANFTGGLRVGYDVGNNNTLSVISNATVHVGAAGLDIGFGGDGNSVSVTDAGSTLISTGPIRIVNGGGPEGNALVIGEGAKVVTPSLIVSNGGFVVLNGRLETGETLVDASIPFYVGLGTAPAVLQLNGGTHSFGLGLGITSGSSLTGCGNINSYLTVIDTNGTIAPDESCQMTFSGTMTNRGKLMTSSTLLVGTNFVQTSSGTLHVQLGGKQSGAYGKINVGNTAEISGTLSVAFANGYTPTTNDTFAIVSASSLSGTFQNILYPTNLVGLRVTYTPTAAIIEITNAPIGFTPVLVGAPAFSNGEFGATFSGQPGGTYLIESTDSLNPANWQTLTNIVASPGGEVLLRDVPLSPSRYYRARYETAE